MNPHYRQVPFAVKWITNRIHVGTSYEEVAREFAERIDNKDAPWQYIAPNRQERARIITEALISHRRNRAEYMWVMGSH